jgi:hypothetical protein
MQSFFALPSGRYMRSISPGAIGMRNALPVNFKTYTEKN